MKALLLAYDFPPRVSVGGTRPYSWYRYWREFDVAPTVVTRQWTNERGYELDYVAPSESPHVLVEETDHGTLVRTPYRPNLSNRLVLRYGSERFRLVRLPLTAWSEVGQYYANVGPRRQLYTAAQRWLRDHGADVIVATGEPFVLFRYAQELSDEFGIPWIADYRDPWSHDPSRRGKRISQGWEARVERRLTSTASAVTTVSNFIAEVIGADIRSVPIHVVPNGYDPEAVGAAADEPQGSEKLTLAYVGSLYPFYPLESVLRVCDAFVEQQEAPRFELLFVGLEDQPAVEELLARRFPGLVRHARFRGRLPNAELAHVLAHANAFLAFNNYAYPGTKIFDYLALKRRVLLCYSDDPEALELKARHYGYDTDHPDTTDSRMLEALLDETDGGTVVRDAKHLREVLADLYEEFLDTGQVACHTHDIERYSRRTQAGRMAEIVKQTATR